MNGFLRALTRIEAEGRTDLASLAPLATSEIDELRLDRFHQVEAPQDEPTPVAQAAEQDPVHDVAETFEEVDALVEAAVADTPAPEVSETPVSEKGAPLEAASLRFDGDPLDTIRSGDAAVSDAWSSTCFVEPPHAHWSAAAEPPNVPLPALQIPAARDWLSTTPAAIMKRCRGLTHQLMAPYRHQGSVMLLFSALEEEDALARELTIIGAMLARERPGGVLLASTRAAPPRIDDLLTSTSSVGMAEVLSGAADWRDAAVSTPVDSLLLLPSGPGQSSPGAADACNVNALVAEWKSQFRVVLVDAAAPADPLTKRFAAASDGAYLIAPLGRATRRTVDRAVASLGAEGGVVRGFVLIDPTVASNSEVD